MAHEFTADGVPRPHDIDLLQLWQAGHYARNCKDKKDSNNSKSPGGHGKQKNNKSSWGKARAEDAAGQKWCPVHATTAHSDEDCC